MILLSIYFMPNPDLISEVGLGSKADEISTLIELWFWRWKR